MYTGCRTIHARISQFPFRFRANRVSCIRAVNASVGDILIRPHSLHRRRAVSAIARMGARNRGRSVLHGRDGASQISARLLRGSIVNFHGIPRADNTRNTGGRQMRDRRCSPELLTTRLETRNKREHFDCRPLEENRTLPSDCIRQPHWFS